MRWWLKTPLLEWPSGMGHNPWFPARNILKEPNISTLAHLRTNWPPLCPSSACFFDSNSFSASSYIAYKHCATGLLHTLKGWCWVPNAVLCIWKVWQTFSPKNDSTTSQTGRWALMLRYSKISAIMMLAFCSRGLPFFSTSPWTSCSWLEEVAIIYKYGYNVVLCLLFSIHNLGDRTVRGPVITAQEDLQPSLSFFGTKNWVCVARHVLCTMADKCHPSNFYYVFPFFKFTSHLPFCIYLHFPN